jgi:PIN domain nuclease of toxin-antitoxin system
MVLAPIDDYEITLTPIEMKRHSLRTFHTSRTCSSPKIHRELVCRIVLAVARHEHLP